MPQEYGAAEPIIDLARKFTTKADKFFSYLPPYEKKTKNDGSYISDQVRKANDSFRKKAEDDKKKVGGTAKKMVVKTSPQKTAVRNKSNAKKTIQKKRVASK
jgi:hypothetical protein